MSDRMTKQRLEERAENVNRRLEAAGSRKRVDVGYRYGYCALDEGYNGERGYFVPVGDAIRVGTKNEIGELLHAMMRALDMADDKVHA